MIDGEAVLLGVDGVVFQLQLELPDGSNAEDPWQHSRGFIFVRSSGRVVVTEIPRGNDDGDRFAA